MIQARGYSTDTFCSLDGGYFCKSTPLQEASYGTKIIQAVRNSDGELLKSMLDCGISPNACNAFGESVIHMVCRRGDYKLLKILLDAGCSLQVTNDFGRTPLHEACWTAAFDCVELILNTDVRLLHIVDCRGSSPLSYIRQEHWKQWIEFFQSKADRYWAPRDLSMEGKEAPPPLVGAPPHSRPIPDPKNAIPVEVATLISAGKLEPKEFFRRKEEALQMRQVATELSAPGPFEEEPFDFWAEETIFDSELFLSISDALLGEVVN
jgi:ankyrin repeat protein